MELYSLRLVVKTDVMYLSFRLKVLQRHKFSDYLHKEEGMSLEGERHVLLQCELAGGLPDGVRIAAAPLEDFVLAEGERFRWTLPERLSSAPKRPDPAVRAWLETVRRIERDASAAERLERIAAMSAAARTAADLPLFAK